MRITRFLLLLMLPFTVGAHWAGAGAENPGTWPFTPGETVGIVLTIVLVVLAVLTLMQMRKKPTRDLPYFPTHDPDKLAGKLFPHRELEEYVVRQQLRHVLGATLIPAKSRVLIHGLPSVGKSREAFELVKRLGRKAVYLDTSGSPEIPALLEPEHPRQKVVLFLDNLRVGTPHPGPEEEMGAQEPTVAQIMRVLEFFAVQTDLDNVVITMTTLEFEKLMDEPESARVLDQFAVVHLKALDPGERALYLEDLATRLGLALDPDTRQPVAESAVSLNDLYDWLERLSQRSDKLVTRADVDEFVQQRRAIWRQNYADLRSEGREVFDSLTLLYAASIPLFEDVTTELALRGRAWWQRPLKRLRLRGALRGLARRYLTIEGGQVYCPDYRLRANEPDGAAIRGALTDLIPIARKLTQRRRLAIQAIRLLKPLSKSLSEQGLVQESITANGLFLNLPREALGGNAPRIRSEAYFHQGLGHFWLGRDTWGQAERCYHAAIKEDDSNKFAKHALASLYWRWHSTDQSLRLLDEIVAAYPSDLLASKTRLDILVDSKRTAEARDAYRALRRLLQGTSSVSKTVLSAEFTCVRYSAALAADLQEEGATTSAERAASRTIARYEGLLARIPEGLRELEAIIRNSYGCFLYDVLSRSDAGLAQLEKAEQVWPEHAHTLHKLATVYLEEAEVRSDEKHALIAQAGKRLRRLLEAHPNHYPARLLNARIEGESTEWLKIDEGSFWPRAAKIYAMYQAAQEPDAGSHPSFHNCIVHHSAGCFLWHVEAFAHKRKMTLEKSTSIPAADKELRDSIKPFEIQGWGLTRAAQHHLILGLYTLGTYLLTVAAGSQEITAEGQRCLTQVVTLSERLGSAYQFNHWNSYAESFVGKLRLSMGDRAQARSLLESAVTRFDRNWRAWWFLGGINELDRRIDDAIRCFERAATGQAAPSLFGQLRSIVKQMKGSATTTEDALRYSSKAYELDPEGNLNPKNLSDYGFDLYQQGKVGTDVEQLKTAERLLVKAYDAYTSAGAHADSNFPLWYAAEARDRRLGYTDDVSLKRYIDAARLSGRRDEYSRLRAKVGRYGTRIWQAGKVIPDDLVDSIESCAKLHPEYEDAALMAGTVLQRNRQDQDALPYLEKARGVKDTYGLRALMECYISLNEEKKAVQVFDELRPLLPKAEQQKLDLRVASLRLPKA